MKGYSMVILLALVITTLVYGNRLYKVQGQLQVQEVCDRYRGTLDRDIYTQCGDLQTKYNMEYLCSSTGTTCWVEVK